MVNRQKVLTKVFGDPQKRIIKALRKRVDAINALAPTYKDMDEATLQKQTAVLKKRLTGKKKATLDDILPDAFALVREASSRVCTW